MTIWRQDSRPRSLAKRRTLEHGRYTCTISAGLTPEQAADVREAAARDGLTVGRWIRRTIVQRARGEPLDEPET